MMNEVVVEPHKKVEPKRLQDLISAERLVEIDTWIDKFPPEQRQSAILQGLRIAQDEHGWLSEPLIEAVAEYLGMPRIAAFEVASFYSLYNLKPVGKYRIDVCNSISCNLNNSEAVIDYLKKKLNIDLNEISADGKFTIRAVECLGACVNAPVCQIGRQYYEKLSTDNIDAIINSLE